MARTRWQISCSGLVLAAQVVILWTLWSGMPAGNSCRADGIPDSGAQRDEMISQLKAANQKLEQILARLSDGNLQVKVAKQDDTSH